MDSYKFLASTIDQLSKKLTKKDSKNMKQYYSQHYLDLLTKKGIYLCDHMDSEKQFEKTKLLKKK